MQNEIRRFWAASVAVSLVMVAVFGAGPVRAQGASIPVQECDSLGQPPRQTMGRLPALAEGVAYEALRGPAAWAACARAMAEFPAEIRFVAYAGRAAGKSGDAIEAARFYRIAADAGNAMAQVNLGAMLENGEGRLPKNPREAERLYRKAAEQDYPGGQATLATLYAFGTGGLARDDREAVRLWQLAAEHENVQAQTNLGTMYAEGRGGLPRDTGEAARMWRMAAAQGSAEARNNLRKLGVRP